MCDGKPLGLALDLGTTTLAARLLDGAGNLLAAGRVPNPQGVIASDIIRRLEAARAGRGRELQGQLAAGVSALATDLLHRVGADRSRLTRVAIAANPGIAHLLAAEPVDRLLFPPHRPVFRGGALYPAERFGLDFPCPVYLFPLVSGYVGGDLVAFLFGAGEAQDCTLFVDVGTNAELALIAGETRLVSSVAAGPAFEGGEIANGMARGPGAVEDVQVVGDRLQLRVVGQGAPQGICGSGLISAIAAALEGGLINTSGTLVAPSQVETNLVRHLGENNGEAVLRLYRDARIDLVLTQQDIHAFQLAKGALRAGIECLLSAGGLTFSDVREIIVTGAFGTAIQPSTLKKVAILPEFVIEKVRFEADGALRGASRYLGTNGSERLVAQLAAKLRPYPLSGTPSFEKAFIAALNF